MGPILSGKRDRHLKAFLTKPCFFWLFCFWCSVFFMCVSWEPSWPLEALLGGLWTQKCVKTEGFLRFLKRLFKAHDGPLGLILVSLVNLFWILCKSAGPFWVSKLHFDLSYVGSSPTSKNLI